MSDLRAAFAGRPVGPIATVRERWDIAPNESLAALGDADAVLLDSAIGDPERGRRSMLALELEPAVVVPVGSRSAELHLPFGSGRFALDEFAFWKAADALLAAESEVAAPDVADGAGVGAPALGWCGYVAYEAGSLADRGLPDVAHDLPFPVLRFDRVRAALVATPDGIELVASGPNDEAARALLERCKARLVESLEDQSLETLEPLEPPDAELHQANVARVRERIAEGRVYQACYTFPLRFRRPPSLAPAYHRLRARSPGDFGAYLRLGALEAASTSPERFVRIEGRRVECRPMKGTRARVRDAVADADLARELSLSEKDRAENVMIVDLMRNDLGRVCEIGSVHVPRLFEVETYATVHQMTSTVSGTLRPRVGPFGVIEAAFPPGSMTGAPKVSACHLLAELEVEPRGLYSGTIGWLGYDRISELSVVIRTLQAWHDTARWNVGGGIVWDSTPEDEFAEAMAKAEALRRAGLLAG